MLNLRPNDIDIRFQDPSSILVLYDQYCSHYCFVFDLAHSRIFLILWQIFSCTHLILSHYLSKQLSQLYVCQIVRDISLEHLVYLFQGQLI